MGEPATNERRVRVYRLHEDIVLDLLHRQGAKWPDVIQIPVLDLPPGAKVLRVLHEWDNLSFSFLVEHESFDPVPEWERPPVAGSLAYHVLAIETVADVEGQRRLMLLNHLEKENAQLRAVFGDLREGSPAAKAAYELGKADGRQDAKAELKDRIDGWVEEVAAGMMTPNEARELLGAMP